MLITFLAMIIVILFIACAILLFLYWHYKRQLQRVTVCIEEIRSGNLNQKIRLHTTQRVLNELGGSMNRLIGDIQRNMEKVNKLESERKNMITHLSHDLRTPLTAILGYVEVLQQDRALTDEQCKRYLQIISSKGYKLDTLIRDFFELSKLEADELPLELRKINIIECVQEGILSFYNQIQQAQLIPQLQLPDYPTYVLGNVQSIERILNNLLSNALRYGSEGGMIGIEVREEKQRVWIAVWDLGQGVLDADLPHIFDRLYTGQASRNSNQQGNGLGLTIVKKLVEKQKGEIYVSSTPGVKTTFSFYLPKAI